jgi:hypothetical protein
MKFANNSTSELRQGHGLGPRLILSKLEVVEVSSEPEELSFESEPCFFDTTIATELGQPWRTTGLEILVRLVEEETYLGRMSTGVASHLPWQVHHRRADEPEHQSYVLLPNKHQTQLARPLLEILVRLVEEETYLGRMSTGVASLACHHHPGCNCYSSLTGMLSRLILSKLEVVEVSSEPEELSFESEPCFAVEDHRVGNFGPVGRGRNVSGSDVYWCCFSCLPSVAADTVQIRSGRSLI